MRNILFVLALAISSVARADEPPVPEDRVVSWMEELRPLPKIHYSWPLPFETISDKVLFEYVRLTHAASLSGEWSLPKEVDRAVAVCHRVNATKPKIPASIAINYSIWHRRFGKELPPTNIGSTHKEELHFLRTRMKAVRDALAAANKKHRAGIAVTAILFDSERFHTKKDDAKWNLAITQKYNAAHDIVRDIFPKTRVEWYGRGAVQPGSSPTGWAEDTHFALDEKGESFNCSLYEIPEIGYTRGIFRRTTQNAVKHGCGEVTPWIALASGYRRQPTTYHKWSYDWNYDLIYSWQLGLELNNVWYGIPERSDRFAPWNMAKVAIFYPEPFGRSPDWGQHFVAYVRGANEIKELPEMKSRSQE